jgi:hypothetical protein
MIGNSKTKNDVSRKAVGLMLGLRVTQPLVFACWPLVPEFEGSNPAEAVGFFYI